MLSNSSEKCNFWKYFAIINTSSKSPSFVNVLITVDLPINRSIQAKMEATSLRSGRSFYGRSTGLSFTYPPTKIEDHQTTMMIQPSTSRC